MDRGVSLACAKLICIGDQCRPVDSTGAIQTDAPVDPNTTKCAPLELNGLYRVAVNNYIAQGGSGFVVLKRNTSQQDTGVSLRDALTGVLHHQSATPPARNQSICSGDATKCIVDTSNTKMPFVFDEFGKIACLDETL